MISQRHNISPLLAKLLNIRNIKEADIENYLNPDLNNNLPDPFLFKDMKKSVERTSEALLKNQLIGIIADYDVDGSTSAAILCKFFNSLNKNIILKIPDRLKDGYGPNIRIMKEMLLYKVKLLFTLDCGTSSFGILTFPYRSLSFAFRINLCCSLFLSSVRKSTRVLVFDDHDFKSICISFCWSINLTMIPVKYSNLLFIISVC